MIAKQWAFSIEKSGSVPAHPIQFYVSCREKYRGEKGKWFGFHRLDCIRVKKEHLYSALYCVIRRMKWADTGDREQRHSLQSPACRILSVRHSLACFGRVWKGREFRLEEEQFLYQWVVRRSKLIRSTFGVTIVIVNLMMRIRWSPIRLRVTSSARNAVRSSEHSVP